MQVSKGVIFGLLMAASGFAASFAFALTPDDFLKEYAAEAKKADPAFKGFDAAAGEKFFHAERKNAKGEEVSCAGCHTKDPTKAGKTRAGKIIEPMAVSANKERFTDKAKVEKWFKRNCLDVYERACTAREKGDFVSYMKSAK
jgi:hypothetical protein